MFLCPREDLNLQPLRDMVLSHACLPFHHGDALQAYPKTTEADKTRELTEEGHMTIRCDP